jgi:hypothetical protein
LSESVTEYLFDTPWWLPITIAAMGIYVFVTGNNRREAKVRNTGAGIIIASLALLAVSYFVDTDREFAEKSTRKLIHAVPARDWATFESLLDPKAKLITYRNREQIVEAAKAAVDRYGLESITITHLSATQIQTQITVNVVMLSSHSDAHNLRSDWQFEWAETPGGWRLVSIDPISIGNTSVEDLRRWLPTAQDGSP